MPKTLNCSYISCSRLIITFSEVYIGSWINGIFGFLTTFWCLLNLVNVMFQVCNKGHVCLQWCSQPVLNRRLHVGDLAMCGTILTSGNNYGKLNLWASMLHLRFPTARQFQAIQGCYIVPTIDSFLSRHQSEILNSFQNIQVVVLG